MKIGINFTPYIKGKVGGMGQYMTSLLHFLPLISPKDIFYIVCRQESAAELKKYHVKVIVIDNNLNPEDTSNKLISIINKNHIDIWYSPLLVLDPLMCPVPSAFCIPDMQHRTFPQFFDKTTLNWREKYYQLSANSAQAIITISDFSRKDIIRCLDVNPSRVKSIHLDAPSYFNSNLKLKSNLKLPLKYIFYPANTWPHKNHHRLLEAFSRVRLEFPNLKLLLSGYSYDSSKELNNLIDKYNLKKHVKFLGYIKDSDMPYVYQKAIGLFFPSLFEGFGIPLVEAMKAKCPIICSNTTSIPEIVDNAGLYFDPLSVNDIATKLKLFLSDQDLRNNLSQIGMQRSKLFSYENTVKDTLKILKSMINTDLSNKIKSKKSPRITIVTPSYNQGKYIERTIKSVLDQKYSNLEYIIMDGGSTDNTVSILKKYSKNIIWESKKDKGQANAINKGLKIATGSIVAFLNSDDTYEPGTLQKVANFFINNPQEYFLYGKGKHIDENNKYIEDYPNGPADYLFLHEQCRICQPTTFWKSEIINDIGYFDESLNYALDYDYWIRVSKKYNLNYLNEYLGNTRFYKNTKTSGQKVPFHNEIIRVQQKHYLTVNESWIFALIHVELEKIDRKSLTQNTYFLLYLIFSSFYLYVSLNHKLPTNRIFKFYLIWFKQLFVFIFKRQFNKL